jgi:F-type H+-transporting ATPase subunit epsilon
MTLHVELVSPESIVYSGDAEMVILRTVGGGDIAFLDGHAPFVGALDIASATIRTAEADERVALHGGFVEVSSRPVAGSGSPEGSAAPTTGATPGSDERAAASRTKVTILSDTAELRGDIDVERARRAKQRAEQQAESERDAETETALRRSQVRLVTADQAVE